MRFVCISLLVGLLVMTTGISFAQDGEAMPAQQTMKATVQPGPVLRTGMPASADVFIGPRLAMRIAASAGGMTPMQRARIIADRINQAFSEGATWEDMRVSQVGKEWTVSIDGRMIATADTVSARMMRVSPGRLASNWGSQTVVALGGEPQMIASQLSPVTTAVAGEVQELEVNWSTTPTKSVPLLNAASGESMGSVTVGGASRVINAVNAVVMYESTQDGAIVRTFVPITGTTTESITRVPGAGLVGIPSDMIPMTGIMMGTSVSAMVSENATEWNSAINNALTQNNTALQAATKVVPLYSSAGEVIGAAQVIGSDTGIAGTQRVTAMTSNNMMQFRAMGAQGTTPINQVVVSSIIYMPSGTPSMTPPTLTPPETPGSAGSGMEDDEDVPDTTETPEGVSPEETMPPETVPPAGPPAESDENMDGTTVP